MKTTITHKPRGRPTGQSMRVITLHLPELYIQAMDQLVKEKYYPNRAELIRTAVRDLLTVEA